MSKTRNYYSFSEKRLVVPKVKNYEYWPGIGGNLVRGNGHVKYVKGRLEYGYRQRHPLRVELTSPLPNIPM